jgi:hypothetical protein
VAERMVVACAQPRPQREFFCRCIMNHGPVHNVASLSEELVASLSYQTDSQPDRQDSHTANVSVRVSYSVIIVPIIVSEREQQQETVKKTRDLTYLLICHSAKTKKKKKKKKSVAAI